MGKKKQPDFQKTKLRVGRVLPKGRNITNTAFKSKKIILPTQKLQKSTSQAENLKDLLNHVSHHNASSRAGALTKVLSQIQENNSFVAHLPDILEKVIKSILDIEPIVRKAAIKVLKAALSSTSDSQIECFMPILISNLRCGMTHCDIKIRQNALEFLDILLETHSKLLSRFPSLLSVILDMISTKYRKENSLKKTYRKRTLPVVYDDNIRSQEWRMGVLKRLENFLKSVLGVTGMKEDEPEDEQIVSWDAEEDLYLPLYAGGGLKPVEPDLTKGLQLFAGKADSSSWTPNDLRNFIGELIPVLMDIFSEEVSEFNASTGGCSLPESTTENVNTIIQIFCCLGDWVKLMSKQDAKLESWFSDKFFDECDKLMKGFPYSSRPKNPQLLPRDNYLPVVRLNLALCYLCCGFVNEVNYTHMYRTPVLKYMQRVFTMKYEQYDSIPMLLKIARRWLSFQYIGKDTMNPLLLGLCGIINVSDVRSNRSAIESFFIEILMEPKYSQFVETPAVKAFFDLLLKELNEMRISNVIDRQLLKKIRKICALGHEYFLKSLQSFRQEELIALMKYEDEDFQETIVCLLCLLNPFNLDYLVDISEVILDPSFGLKPAFQLIRSLARRFSEGPPSVYERVRLACIRFLLNVACDSFAISDEKWANFEDEFNFHENWSMVDDLSPYRIYPSVHWKRHSKIFQVCKESLMLFPSKEVSVCIYKYFLQILKHASAFPVHCVISLWRIQRECEDSVLLNSRQWKSSLNSLLFSSFLYCSVLSRNCQNDEYFTYAVIELTKSIHIESKVCDLLKEIDNESQKIKDVIAVQYLLRIMFFLLSGGYLNSDNKRIFWQLLRYLKDMLGEEVAEASFEISAAVAAKLSIEERAYLKAFITH